MHRNKQICGAHIPKRGKINTVNYNFPLHTENVNSAIQKSERDGFVLQPNDGLK